MDAFGGALNEDDDLGSGDGPSFDRSASRRRRSPASVGCLPTSPAGSAATAACWRASPAAGVSLGRSGAELSSAACARRRRRVPASGTGRGGCGGRDAGAGGVRGAADERWDNALHEHSRVGRPRSLWNGQAGT